jgi:phosphinothricin acetyltransferase
MASIYNESALDGCSPVLWHCDASGIRKLLEQQSMLGLPTWVLLHDSEVIAWACAKPLPWGQNICPDAVDYSLYVARTWHGRGAALAAIRFAYRDLGRYGIAAVTCWILGSNRRSLALARAVGWQRWGLFPGVARFGERCDSVEIWGARSDDERWRERMRQLESLHARRLVRLGAQVS